MTLPGSVTTKLCRMIQHFDENLLMVILYLDYTFIDFSVNFVINMLIIHFMLSVVYSLLLTRNMLQIKNLV